MGDVNSEAAGGSEMANVWGALLEPRRTFARLAARPTLVIALLVLVVLGAASVWVGFSKVDPQDMLRSLEEQGRELPPSMVEAPEPWGPSGTITPYGSSGFASLPQVPT